MLSCSERGLPSMALIISARHFRPTERFLVQDEVVGAASDCVFVTDSNMYFGLQAIKNRLGGRLRKLHD